MYAVPATLIGFLLLFIFNSGVSVFIFTTLEIAVEIQFQPYTYQLGIITGIMLPLVSNIFPIRQAMNKTLRDSLDLSRSGVDESEVEAVRLEDKGVDSSHVSLATAILFISFVSLYLMPRAFISSWVERAFFWLNTIFICVMIGTLFCLSGLAPKLSELFIELLYFAFPSDRQLKPIVVKNMQQHSGKNMKSILLYAMTTCFLIYSSANQISTAKYLSQMGVILFGAHLNLRSLTAGEVTVLDEMPLRQAIAPLLVENGGAVANYTFLSSSIDLQLSTKGRQPVKEFILGTGIIQAKNPIKRLSFSGIEPSTLDTVLTERIYYPSEVWNQPFGPGTRFYTEHDITDLLMDLRQDGRSEYVDKFDPLNIISQNPERDLEVSGEIINMVMPRGLHGEVFQEMGDVFTYCLSTGAPQQFRSFQYKPNSCQIKYKMRVVASFNKVAGFPKLSGYKQANAVGPGMFALNNQVAGILDRMSVTYPELDETRRLCISESPSATQDLRKETLLIKLAEGTEKQERVQVLNTILSVVEESSFLVVDMVEQEARLVRNMKAMEMFNALTSIICFLLGSFQLVQTVAANVKESMWELGVLRSMGLTNNQITRVMMFEMIGSIMSACAIGYVAGIFVSLLSVAQFHLFVELPMSFSLPLRPFVVTGVVATLSYLFGAYFGTNLLKNKNISSILKGQ